MGANIGLWQYKIYENGIFQLEEVHSRTGSAMVENTITNDGKNPVMVEAVKKAAETRKNATYTLEEHLQNLPKPLLELFEEIRDFIVSLDSSIEEIPKKYYIAYKTSQNFVCVQIYKEKLKLYPKLNPDEYKPLPPLTRDVRDIGRFGSGDLEVALENRDDFEGSKGLVEEAYRAIGG